MRQHTTYQTKWNASFKVGITQITDYSPFGVELDGRTIQDSKYRYSFQNQEHHDEVSGNGNSYTAEFWQYSPRLGRRWNLDPVPQIFISDYVVLGNNPIIKVDIKGNTAEDFVINKKTKQIRWDKNANSQSTTKAGETYLGKNLSFTFNSYIGDNYDGSLGSFPEGDKLTSTINISASENSAGILTGLSASFAKNSPEIGKTFGRFKGRDYYPGEGGSNNYLKSSGTNVNYEQHASVPSFEESGLNILGFRVVDVAQKLDISFNKNTGNLSVSAYTNVFLSATLKLNNTNTMLMNYRQPSFVKTHTAPIKGWTTPASSYKDNSWSRPIRNFSYYPSVFYKR